jgi:hypothetical protein
VIENLVAEAEGDLDLRIMAKNKEIARANPLRVVKGAALRRYWGDLHGQSGETIGMGTAENYFRYARDAAFIDIVGHQGNDFQITDTFWNELNRLTSEFDEPASICLSPGIRMVRQHRHGWRPQHLLPREGRPIRRSSHILVEGQTSTEAIYTADELFRALEGEDAVVIATSAGAMRDLKYAHDGSTPNVPSRCTRPGARSNGFDAFERDTASAGRVTATITRAPRRYPTGRINFGAIGGSPASHARTHARCIV